MTAIKLQTGLDVPSLILSDIQKSEDGTYQCIVSVKTGKTAFDRTFSFDHATLSDVIKQLDQACHGSLLPVNLKSATSNDFLRFQKNRLSDFFVSGEFATPSPEKFDFRTHQEAMRPLLADLSAI